MKAGFVSLELGFDKVIGEGGADRRQVGIALPVLRDIVVAGDAFHLDYEGVILIVFRGWSRTTSSAGPG